MKGSVRREPAAEASDGERPAQPAGARWQAVALPPEHGSWGLVGEPARRALAVAAHGVALATVALLTAAGWLPWLAASAVALLLARAAWGLSRHRRPATARAVGFGEIAWGVVTVLLVAAGFWP